jgi:hypothetical protein
MARIWHLSILQDRTENTPALDTRYFVAADDIAEAVRALRAHVPLNGRLDASEVSTEEASLYGAEDLKPGEFMEIAVIEGA